MGNLERAMAYLEKLPPAIAGSGGHDATLRAACECIRFGLSDSEIAEAMNWYNVNRCKPEWKPKELAHKIASAKRLAKFGERGQPARRDRVVRAFQVVPVAVRVILAKPIAPPTAPVISIPSAPMPPSAPKESWPDVMTFGELSDLRAEGGGPHGTLAWPPGATRPLLTTESR